MSLLVLILIGAGVGCLAGLMLRRGPLSLAAEMWIGIAGAFVAGAMAGENVLLEGLTTVSLVAAGLGALVLLLVVNLAMRVGHVRDQRQRGWTTAFFRKG